MKENTLLKDLLFDDIKKKENNLNQFKSKSFKQQLTGCLSFKSISKDKQKPQNFDYLRTQNQEIQSIKQNEDNEQFEQKNSNQIDEQQQDYEKIDNKYQSFKQIKSRSTIFDNALSLEKRKRKKSYQTNERLDTPSKIAIYLNRQKIIQDSVEYYSIKKHLDKNKSLFRYYLLINTSKQTYENFVYIIKKYIQEQDNWLKLSTEDFWSLILNQDNFNRETVKFISMYFSHPLPQIENNILKNKQNNIISQDQNFYFYSQKNQSYKTFDIFLNHQQYVYDNFSNEEFLDIFKKSNNEQLQIFRNTKTHYFVPYQTNCALDLRLGSQWSIRFFEILEDANPQIHQYFKSIISYKFAKTKSKFLIIAFYYQFLLLFYFLQLVIDEKHELIFAVLTLITDLILLYLELCTGFYDNLINHLDLYNTIDLIVQGTIIILSILTILNFHSQSITIVQTLTLLLLNIRTLLEFRIYRAFRFLLRIVRNVFFDLFPFIIVTIFFVFIYACLMFNLDKFYGRPIDFLSNLPIALNQGFGQYEIDYQQEGVVDELTDISSKDPYEFLDWCAFVFCTFILTVMNLNIVIALITQTFESYESQKEQVDLEDELNMIVDMEKLFHNNKSFWSKIKLKILGIILFHNTFSSKWSNPDRSMKQNFFQFFVKSKNSKKQEKIDINPEAKLKKELLDKIYNNQKSEKIYLKKISKIWEEIQKNQKHDQDYTFLPQSQRGIYN